MPAHVKDLLIEINLVRIGFFLHPATWTSRATRPGTILLSVGPLVHRCRYADLLCLESRLVGLQHNLGVLARFGGVNHEVVVVTACHDILCITREDNFEFVKDTIVLVGVTQSWP